MLDNFASRLSAGCYVDLFERPRFVGTIRRLPGPAIYRHLRQVKNGLTRFPGVAIESVIVGPGAFVMCFDDDDFNQTVAWLSPGDRRASLAEFGLSASIDSFQVLDRAPEKGELGFDAFARRAGRRA